MVRRQTRCRERFSQLWPGRGKLSQRTERGGTGDVRGLYRGLDGTWATARVEGGKEWRCLVEVEEGCVCRREGGRVREVRSNKVYGSWRKFALLLLLCPVRLSRGYAAGSGLASRMRVRGRCPSASVRLGGLL